MIERKVCTECGKEKDILEFYDKYARCKQCTREDQNAINWYKAVSLQPYEEWPTQLQAYVETRRSYVSQGHNVPATTKEMILAYNLSQGDDPEAPTEVSLPVVVALHRRVMLLTERVNTLTSQVEALTTANTDHAKRTMSGELKNLYKAVCKEMDQAIRDNVIDAMDAADVKEGVRLINQSILTDTPVSARAVLDSVLTLAQLQLSLPAPLCDLYYKYYKPHLPHAAEADVQRVIDIAGVNLYEVDWVEFLKIE